MEGDFGERPRLTAAATDEVLVGAARARGRPVFAELRERHSAASFKMAFRFTKNLDDPEDVIQDAWLKAYVHLHLLMAGQNLQLG